MDTCDSLLPPPPETDNVNSTRRVSIRKLSRWSRFRRELLLYVGYHPLWAEPTTSEWWTAGQESREMITDHPSHSWLWDMDQLYSTATNELRGKTPVLITAAGTLRFQDKKLQCRGTSWRRPYSCWDVPSMKLATPVKAGLALPAHPPLRDSIYFQQPNFMYYLKLLFIY